MALRISIVLFFIVQFYVARAQYDQFLGNFPIYNFTNDDFNSPVQIWTGCQTENGVLLFGNDEKIIRFNGKDWTFIQSSVKDTAYTTKQISNKKVYKLFKSTTGIVYGARNNSLGIIKYDKKGNHKYEAFYVDENLKNVWSIDELPNGDIIFINQNNILRYELATQTVHFINVPKLMQLSNNQSTARISKGLIISATHILNDSLVKAEGQGATYFLNYTDLSIARIFVEGVSKELLTTYFDDYFVFYRPKDIVSGDFYWARQINGKILWSAIDCTGHGVPGAMVSIVGNNNLLRATNEFQLVKPNEILDKLRELVLESFKAQGTNDVKDGMDLGLACIDKDKMQLEFSGANNSCVIVRNGELIEIKGDKQPIGDFELAKPFTNQTFHLENGDNIYLFTDGYVDQFGGENDASRQNGGKKFKSKHFKQFLIDISHHEMKTQEKLIVEKFDNWRGEIEAIDDVCVFGVKI